MALSHERLSGVEYLIGYEGNAFACAGNVQEDLLSITSVHPMREEAMAEFLKKSWHQLEDCPASDREARARRTGISGKEVLHASTARAQCSPFLTPSLPEMGGRITNGVSPSPVDKSRLCNPSEAVKKFKISKKRPSPTRVGRLENFRPACAKPLRRRQGETL
jgi:hypothetical protein